MLAVCVEGCKEGHKQGREDTAMEEMCLMGPGRRHGPSTGASRGAPGKRRHHGHTVMTTLLDEAKLVLSTQANPTLAMEAAELLS